MLVGVIDLLDTGEPDGNDGVIYPWTAGIVPDNSAGSKPPTPWAIVPRTAHLREPLRL
jgi:hypothetical protein